MDCEKMYKETLNSRSDHLGMKVAWKDDIMQTASTTIDTLLAFHNDGSQGRIAQK